MQIQKLVVASALVAVFSVAALSPASAVDAPKNEKCYGIAKAGSNDCASASNSCAGHSTKDGQGFVSVPAGTCAKIVGGSMTEPTK